MKKPSNFSLRRRVLIGYVGVAISLTGINACSPSTQTQAVSSAENVNVNNLNETEQKLVGQWEAIKDEEKIVLAFTPDKKIIIWVDNDEEAVKMGYEIDAEMSPMHIDIGELEGKSMPTILELISDNEMQFQFPDRFKEEQQRPEDFGEDSFTLKKISDSAELPSYVEVIALEELNKRQVSRAREAEGKNILGSVNRAQQSHHFEMNRFASSFQDLGITTNGKFYDFEISSMKKNQATAVAIPKEAGLKSFVASMSYDPSSRAYNSAFCYSNEPSKEALPSPEMEGNSLKCPAGTSQL